MPWFKFYPSVNFKRCSLKARGAWVTILSLMHECSDRGVLSDCAGQPWPVEDIAVAVGVDRAEMQEMLHELCAKGVVNRNSVGAYFCQQMVDEGIKALKCSEAGKRGGRPTSGETAKKRVEKGSNKGPPKRIERVPSISSSFSFMDGEIPEGEESAQKWFESKDSNQPEAQKKPTTSPAQCVYDHYRKYHPKTPVQVSTVQQKLIQARLAEGFSETDLQDAIDGNHRSPFHCGQNESNTKYHNLDLIFRSANHVLQFVEVPHDTGPVVSDKTRRTLTAAERFRQRKSQEATRNGQPA